MAPEVYTGLLQSKCAEPCSKAMLGWSQHTWLQILPLELPSRGAEGAPPDLSSSSVDREQQPLHTWLPRIPVEKGHGSLLQTAACCVDGKGCRFPVSSEHLGSLQPLN